MGFNKLRLCLNIIAPCSVLAQMSKTQGGTLEAPHRERKILLGRKNLDF